MIDDDAQIRYQRQLILHDWDEQTQYNISQARLAIIGAGGLGAALVPYLNGLGVGYMRLIDADIIEEHNLHRQIIYDEAAIGQHKATILAQQCRMRNHYNVIEPYIGNITATNGHMLHNIDLIIDCTDNPDTRYINNAHSLQQSIPLLSVSAIRHEGQLLWLNSANNAPCYHCVFDNNSHNNAPISRCDTMGVNPAIIGHMASLACNHIINYIGQQQHIEPFMLLSDIQDYTIRNISLKKHPSCPICTPNK